jgi:hypothetical protein
LQVSQAQDAVLRDFYDTLKNVDCSLYPFRSLLEQFTKMELPVSQAVQK